MSRVSKYQAFSTKFRTGMELAGAVRAKILRINTNNEKWRVIDSYEIKTPFYSRPLRVEIKEHIKTGERIYTVREPKLNPKELAIYSELHDIFLYMNLDIEDFSDRNRVLKIATKKLENMIYSYAIARGEGVNPENVKYYVMRDVVGYGPIDPLLRDPYIEDVSCDGPYVPVYVWHRKYEYMPTDLIFKPDALDALVIKMANMSGKHISTAEPVLDAILPGGHRLAATFRREVTTRGSTFTIRKFREDPITIVDMITWRTLIPDLAAYFWILMEHKKCGLILGVTGAGKTSTLNALATMLHPSVKVVTIEDTPELRLPLDNWVQLVSRSAVGGEGSRAEITLFDLIKIALRYRPDIIIVGEVRGEEAYVLFQAMATGHGGITTMHAEHIDAAVKRLTSPPMNIPQGYIPLVNFALVIKRVEMREEGKRKIVRRITNVWEVLDYGKYATISEWFARDDSFHVHFENSKVLRDVADAKGWDYDYVVQVEIPRRAALLRWLALKGVRNYKQVAEHIYAYYNDPRAKMKAIYEDCVKMTSEDERFAQLADEIYPLVTA